MKSSTPAISLQSHVMTPLSIEIGVLDSFIVVSRVTHVFEFVRHLGTHAAAIREKISCYRYSSAATSSTLTRHVKRVPPMLKPPPVPPVLEKYRVWRKRAALNRGLLSPFHKRPACTATSAAGSRGAYAWCQPRGCKRALREQTATDSRLRTLHVTTTGRSQINADSAVSTLSALSACGGFIKCK